MKHAIMIMAHKNFGFLRHLIEYFSRDCYVFVHIDKKSSITREEQACLAAMPQVSGVYRKYSVHWGGFSILKCELFLLKEAMRSSDADYFHLISGQDYPIKPLSTFLEFFEKYKGKEFLQYVHLPHPRWDNNTYARFQYIHVYDWFIRSKKTSLLINQFVNWQKKHGLKRRIPDDFDHLYGASQWFTITRNSVTILINYTKNHSAFYRRMRFVFAPEEVYIATVLLNLINKEQVCSYHYRYIRWKYDNGNLPANLNESYFRVLAKSKALLSRKFEMPISCKLMRNIDNYLLKDSNMKILPTGGWDYNGFLQYEYCEPLMLAIYKICLELKLLSIVDVGCGAGFYVAALRRLGIPIAGYDANPYCTKLSSLLLPSNDEPCGILDITSDLNDVDCFDMVLAIDVISYIPLTLQTKAIHNLCKLSEKYLLICYQKTVDFKKSKLDNIVESIKNNNMRLNVVASNIFSFELEEKGINRNLLLFQRCE